MIATVSPWKAIFGLVEVESPTVFKYEKQHFRLMVPIWPARQGTYWDVRSDKYLTGPWQRVLAIHLRIGCFRWNPAAYKEGRYVEEWAGFRLTCGAGRAFRGESQ